MLEAIAKLVRGESLSEAEASAAMETIMCDEATPAQIAGFVVALRMKGETVAEITGMGRFAPAALESAALPADGAGALEQTRPVAATLQTAKNCNTPMRRLRAISGLSATQSSLSPKTYSILHNPPAPSGFPF